jgi:hypothetical protein
MKRSELSHVGIVVPDLEGGRARFAELLDIVWGPIMEIDGDFRDRAGSDFAFHLRLCLSTIPPYLELIEEMPGTEWECNEHSNLHHIGFYSDALVADSGQLSAARCPFTLGSRQDGELTMAYHRDPLGVRVELVDTALRPMIEQTMCVPPTTGA